MRADEKQAENEYRCFLDCFSYLVARQYRKRGGLLSHITVVYAISWCRAGSSMWDMMNVRGGWRFISVLLDIAFVSGIRTIRYILTALSLFFSVFVYVSIIIIIIIMCAEPNQYQVYFYESLCKSYFVA